MLEVFKILGYVIPICLTAFAMTKLVFSQKNYKQLPDCREHFDRLDKKTEDMKQGSTDRVGRLHAVESRLAIIEEHMGKQELKIENISDKISNQATSIGLINQNLDHIKSTLTEINKKIEKS